MREKQKGNTETDAKKAAIKNALVAAGVDEDKADAGAEFIDESADSEGLKLFDLEEVQNSSAEELKKAAENVSSGIDPKDAKALNDLINLFPEYSDLFEKYKAYALRIWELVSSQSTTDRKRAAVDERVLQIYTNEENDKFFSEKISDTDGDAFLELLIDDPAFFAKFLPALKKNPSLPPVLFQELAKLNLTASELDRILSDVGTGSSVEGPSGNPPSNSSLSLAEEATLLHLLQDHGITLPLLINHFSFPQRSSLQAYSLMK